MPTTATSIKAIGASAAVVAVIKPIIDTSQFGSGEGCSPVIGRVCGRGRTVARIFWMMGQEN